MKNLLLLATVAVAGCAVIEPGEKFVVEGEGPAVSPDGSKVAFHRYEDKVMKIGLCGAEGGAVDWIEAGPAMAAYPAWSPSGALVYTYGREPATAYQVDKGKAKPEGYGLRVREADGRTRELVTGYTRDYLPSVSPDGKWVYFTTTREVKSPSKNFSLAMFTNIAKVPLDGSKPPEVILRAPNGCNSGVVQPVVSPDGKYLAWQHMDNFSPDGWSVYAARLDRLDRAHCVRIVPALMTALAPRWHPSGRYLAFTGFMPDDPGWGVWIMDMSTFALKRIADGENPAFSPDGKWIYYDRERRIYRKALTSADMPTAADVIRDMTVADRSPAERVVWSKKGTGRPETYAVSGDDFKVAADQTVFVRAKVVWNGKDDMQMFFSGVWGESDQGLIIYLGKEQKLWFSSRNAANQFAGASVKLEKAGEYDVIGVRTKDGYHLSVNGSWPVRGGSAGMLPLKTPKTFKVGFGLKPGSAVKDVEFGFGWPKGIPTVETVRQEVFK